MYMALVCESKHDGCAGVAGCGVGVDAQLGQVLRGVRGRVSFSGGQLPGTMNEDAARSRIWLSWG
jgi:hypothetical protein